MYLISILSLEKTEVGIREGYKVKIWEEISGLVIGVDGRKQGGMPIGCDYLQFVASYYSLSQS